MSVSALGEALRDLSALLAAEGVRWYLFGAQAVAVYGSPRLTADVDATVELGLDRVAGFTEVLNRSGFGSRVEDVDAFARRTRVIPITHSRTGIPVDLVVAGPGLEEEFLDRAGVVEMEGIEVPVISPEDLVITKILAGRPKDLEDVRAIFLEQSSEPDLGRIRDVLGLLERALDRSDLTDRLETILAETGSED